MNKVIKRTSVPRNYYLLLSLCYPVQSSVQLIGSSVRARKKLFVKEYCDWRRLQIHYFGHLQTAWTLRAQTLTPNRNTEDRLVALFEMTPFWWQWKKKNIYIIKSLFITFNLLPYHYSIVNLIKTFLLSMRRGVWFHSSKRDFLQSVNGLLLFFDTRNLRLLLTV